MTYWLKQTFSGTSAAQASAMSGVQWTLDPVIQETITKNANLMIIPMPLADSSLTDVFDYMGTTREITIEGIYSHANSGSLTGWVGSLQSFIFGQQTKAWFNSDLLAGSIPVKINYVNADWQGGQVTNTKWSIKMTESTTTS